jgi:uncharacterized membrane protein YgdD (TMEM256/DUF423 family)
MGAGDAGGRIAAVVPVCYNAASFLITTRMTMSADRAFQRVVLTGCLLAGVGVAAGAFGAHMLKSVLDPPMLAVYDTAARYQMLHAIGMVLAGFAARLCNDARFAVAGWIFAAGIFLFCGSLYAVALLGTRWLGAITPFGGVAFMLGWGWLGWRAWRQPLTS